MKEATCRRGHALHLVISKAVGISKTAVKDVGPSDLFCVFFEMSVSPVAQTESLSVRKRFVNEQTAHLFMRVISTSWSESADVPLDHFESKAPNSY